MCDCQGNVAPVEQQVKVMTAMPCEVVTVDLLKVFKKPIDCYLKYGIFESIGETRDSVAAAADYLQGFIYQKVADPSDCTGIERLADVRALVDKIMTKGICL